MFRYNLDIPVIARGEFFGCGREDFHGKVIAVEFYPKDIPTFIFRSNSGHLFSYLPPQAFSSYARHQDELVDIECPESVPYVFNLEIEGDGFGRIGERIETWQSYVCSADWVDENILVHCVLLYDGSFAFIRNSRFQIGGSNWNPPNWKKLRKEWKLGGH